MVELLFFAMAISGGFFAIVFGDGLAKALSLLPAAFCVAAFSSVAVDNLFLRLFLSLLGAIAGLYLFQRSRIHRLRLRAREEQRRQ